VRTAPITMEVFSDFECPSCRALYEGTLRQLMDGYVAQGKVYLIHHDFPLPMHKYSWLAARYANAAARIGEFREVEGALFDNQAEWTENGDLAKYVAQALTPAEMHRVERIMEPCKDAPPNKDSATCPLDAGILRDVELGQEHHVQVTPTFVITAHGKSSTSSGVVTYEVLRQYFDYLLNQK
jgi:protein-disulfide isomerase